VYVLLNRNRDLDDRSTAISTWRLLILVGIVIPTALQIHRYHRDLGTQSQASTIARSPSHTSNASSKTCSQAKVTSTSQSSSLSRVWARESIRLGVVVLHVSACVRTYGPLRADQYFTAKTPSLCVMDTKSSTLRIRRTRIHSLSLYFPFDYCFVLRITKPRVAHEFLLETSTSPLRLCLIRPFDITIRLLSHSSYYIDHLVYCLNVVELGSFSVTRPQKPENARNS
jgi:hypothetical protein